MLLLLLDNDKFCRAFAINKLTLEYRLSAYETANASELTLDEFINFVLYPQHILIH